MFNQPFLQGAAFFVIILGDVEYAMLSAGIKYFNTCAEYWLYKVESEYIKAEKEYLAKLTDI